MYQLGVRKSFPKFVGLPRPLPTLSYGLQAFYDLLLS